MGKMIVSFEGETVVSVSTELDLADSSSFMEWARHAYPPENDEQGNPMDKEDVDYCMDVGAGLIEGTLNNVNSYLRDKAAREAAAGIDPVEPVVKRNK